MGAMLASVATIVLALILRTRIRTRYETATYPTPSTANVIPGAEDIALRSGDRGILILHGFGDTPQSVRGLAELLHQRGWTVRAPLLRGHGSSLSAFTGSRAEEWLADAREALSALHVTRVAIVGQSMGGALAAILAAEHQVEALVLLAPYMQLSTRAAIIARFHHVVSAFVPYLRSKSESSILDPEARRRALGKGVTTPRLVRELSRVVRQARRSAPSVRSPTLVVHSPQDPRITVSDAESAFARLGCPVKTLKWARGSGHVLSVDYDREWVRSEVVQWLETHVAGA
jgi:carboxylesterase